MSTVAEDQVYSLLVAISIYRRMEDVFIQVHNYASKLIVIKILLISRGIWEATLLISLLETWLHLLDDKPNTPDEVTLKCLQVLVEMN